MSGWGAPSGPETPGPPPGPDEHSPWRPPATTGWGAADDATSTAQPSWTSTPSRGRGRGRLIAAVVVVLIAAGAVTFVVVRRHHDTASTATSSTPLRPANAATVTGAVPTSGDLPAGWVSAPGSTLTFYSLLQSMLVCGVDTSGATLPTAQAEAAFQSPPAATGTPDTVAVAVIAMRSADDSHRLLEIGRAAATCVQRFDRGPTGLRVTVEHSPSVVGVDGEPLALTIDGSTGQGAAALHAVAVTTGAFGVAAIAPTTAEATRWVDRTLARLHE